MTQPTETPVEPQVIQPPVGSRRQRAALVGLSVAFGLWVAALAAMYAFEVYPHRHPKQPAVVAPAR